MPSYRQGDVVVVPFPYTDRTTRQRRPAVVLSVGELENRHGLLWVIMVTSAENRGWAGDVRITDHLSVGLPSPSLVRTAKIATIEAQDAALLGRLPLATTRSIKAKVAEVIGAKLS